MLALTETWLGTDTDNQVINELVPSGYTIQHISRPSEKRGGGVAVLYKCGLTIKTFYTERHVHTFRTYGLHGHFQLCEYEIVHCVPSAPL